MISLERLEELRNEATEDILGVPVLNPMVFAALIIKECETIFMGKK